MGQVHPRVGSGRLGVQIVPYLVGWVRSGAILYGSVWITLVDTECYANFSELLVMFMFGLRCTLCLHRKSKFHSSLNFLRRFLIFCTKLQIKHLWIKRVMFWTPSMFSESWHKLCPLPIILPSCAKNSIRFSCRSGSQLRGADSQFSGELRPRRR